ncbi:MAG: four-carbon acid sugar kinase family protein [Burkholderiaceae bacterium]
MSAPLRLTFYGDDFTGSTDAMEALALSGLRTVLFLRAPSAEEIATRYADVACVGVAGTSRAMSPAEMDDELVPVLEALWALGAPLLHYKVCSTFDSSPTTGSIGHVIDQARERLNAGRTVPIVAGAPALRRYTVFGNHFAAAGDSVDRLDRHPTMSRHPVTPMPESDLRRHLGDQTSGATGLMSLEDLAGSSAQVDSRFAQHMADSPAMLLFDVLDDVRLLETGRLLWQEAGKAPQFVVGSSGVGYALSSYWRQAGLIPDSRARFPTVAPVDQLLVLSGSASPATAQQIGWAVEHGVEAQRVPTAAMMQSDSREDVRQALYKQTLAAWSRSKSVVLYTAAGPDDPAIAQAKAVVTEGVHSARVLGGALGLLARDLIAQTGLRRVLIAGGDTSSYATQELGVRALEMAAELTPGAPLCRAHSDDPLIDGLEIALKGGQMGGPDYFGRVRGD